MGMTWTSEQQQVIHERGRNILVSAAAGSGKTAVLVERIIQKITDKNNPTDIDRLLVVTFTHAAAAEMKERIGAAIDKKLMESPEDMQLEKQAALLRSAQITTIHSFCLYVIRNHFNEIDLDPSFRIADEMELTLMRADTMEQLLEEKYEEGDEAFLEFVECYAKGKTDEGIEALISQLYTYSRSYPWPKLWLDSCRRALEADDEKSFNELPLIGFLKEYISHVLKDIENQIKTALEICARPDGPVFYDEALNDDLRQIHALLACRTLDEYKQAADAVKWKALSRKKMPEASEENKALVKGIREAVKATADKLKKDFFYAPVSVMLKDIQKTVRPMGVLLSLVKQFSERYQKKKEEKNVLDFGDLEHFALDILLKRTDDGRAVPSAAAKELSERFDEVLCDEYQDSNLVQETLLKAVSKEAAGGFNIFMVGDVKQSIYKFRLARPELFMEKYKAYPADGSSAECLRIDLHKNFRSRRCVVDFVNLIFQHIMGEALGGIVYDDDAALNCGAAFPEYTEKSGFISTDTEVLLIDTGDDEEIKGQMTLAGEMTSKDWEAKAVADKIHRLMAEGMCVVDKKSGGYRKLQFKDIVILLRTMQGYSDSFRTVLEREHIPAYSDIASGFFDTLEIRTMVCFLSIIDNPLQDIALAAVMKSCLFNFSDETLAMIRSVSKNTNFYHACLSFMEQSSDGLLEACFDMEKCREIRGQLKTFIQTLEKFRQCIFYMPIHKLILKIYDETGYYHLVSAMPLGQKRQANLDMLVAKAVDYEKTSYKGLFNFVRYIRRLEKYEADMGEASVFSENEDAVRIMSIHKSKGLEYPVVFVSGMTKRFNQQDARSSLLIHSEYGLGPEAVDEKARIKCPTILKNALAHKIITENLSEELRVLYVALTRAKERLILTGTLDNMQRAFEKWQRTSEGASHMLAYTDLCAAGNYLDWVMPVILNERFRRASGAEVDIKTTKISELIEQKAEALLSSRIMKGQLEAMPEKLLSAKTEKTIEERLGWAYPFAETVNMHAKMTVSELKHLEDGYEENDADDSFTRGLLDTAAAEADADAAPEPLYEKAEFSEKESGDTVRQRIEAAAKRGTAVHKLMELLDIGAVKTIEDAECFIRKVCEMGAIDKETAKKISPWLIFNFCRSPLGKRMAKAQMSGRLYREKQFMLGLCADEIFETDTKETILIQGVMDACFEENNKLVLVDYKTDFVKDKNEAILAERYRKQLEYYEKAAVRLLGLPVCEKYIYSFSLNKAIRV